MTDHMTLLTQFHARKNKNIEHTVITTNNYISMKVWRAQLSELKNNSIAIASVRSSFHISSNFHHHKI